LKNQLKKEPLIDLQIMVFMNAPCPPLEKGKALGEFETIYVIKLGPRKKSFVPKGALICIEFG